MGIRKIYDFSKNSTSRWYYLNPFTGEWEGPFLDESLMALCAHRYAEEHGVEMPNIVKAREEKTGIPLVPVDDIIKIIRRAGLPFPSGNRAKKRLQETINHSVRNLIRYYNEGYSLYKWVPYSVQNYDLSRWDK